MAVDKKISQLASGAPAQAGDEYVVARSGANYKLTLTNIAASMPATTITTGNLTFSSTAQRITGDMSNATIANRLAFQTSTANTFTDVIALPNGTGTLAQFAAYSNSNPANASFGAFRTTDATDVRLLSGISGTGTYLPMTFYTGGAERVRIDTSGNVGFGTASPGLPIDVVSSSVAYAIRIRGRSSDNVGIVQFTSNTAGAEYATIKTPAADTLAFTTGASERMRIDSSGNVGIGGTASAFAKVQKAGTLPTSSNISVGDYITGTIPSGSTSAYYGYYSAPTTQATSFTCGAVIHYYTNPQAFGAGSTVTNQYGYIAESTITGATNNYGFFSNIASGSNRWNFYAAGTAVNYFAGDTRIGTTADLGQGARLNILSADNEADLITLRYSNATAGKHWRIAIDSASTFLLLNQAGTPVGVQLTDGGNSWSSSSDERQKTDLKLIEDAASKVGTLRAVTGRYTFDEETESRSFLIAQDVQKVLPEAVKQGADGSLLLAYQDVIPLLVAAIKELTSRVAELEAK
jgi:hypothetical protein